MRAVIKGLVSWRQLVEKQLTYRYSTIGPADPGLQGNGPDVGVVDHVLLRLQVDGSRVVSSQLLSVNRQ